jgi:hypothetical protein
LPSTLRIGSRLYGIKTHATDSAEEENLRNSEFEAIYLDRLFRTHKKRYSVFAKELIEKRLAAAYGLPEDGSKISTIDTDWAGYFEAWDDNWNSKDILSLVGGAAPFERRHFLSVREKLATDLSQRAIDKVIENLIAEEYPLLEKLNLLLLFQDLFKGRDPVQASAEIKRMCRDFIVKPTNVKSRYSGTLDHFKNDLVAQLRRENDTKQYYLGLDTFIAMSAGLPRALLTIFDPCLSGHSLTAKIRCEPTDYRYVRNSGASKTPQIGFTKT